MVKFNIGDKVTYDSGFGPEKGIVKSFPRQEGFAYVVYRCNKDWDNFKEYTAELTAFKYLQHGWYEEEE